jgi:DNA sulfur modification protein DndD
MKFAISSIEMTNYRQYKGTQKLQFTSDKSKNVAIIYGRNGSGKSNVLNAITWCLYGKEIHKKYEEIDDDNMPLINSSVLRSLQNDETSYAEVTIHLQTDAGAWLVSRKMEGGKDSYGKLWFSESKLMVVHPVGNQDKVDTGEGTKRLVNNILPDALKSFFFIDGEQLREFFRVSSPDEVAKAIDTVSQLELVYKASSHLELLEKDLRKNIKTSTPQLDTVVRQIEFVQSQIEQFRDRISDVKKDKQNDEAALDVVKEYLRGHNVEKIAALEDKRQMLEAEKDRLIPSIEEQKLKRNQYLVHITPFIFLKAPIENTYVLITEGMDKGELPPKIKETFVHELIEEGRCICGNELTSESTATLVEFSKHLALSELSEVAWVGKTTIEQILSEIQEFPKTIDSMNKSIDKQESRLEEIKRDLEQIGDDVAGFDEEEVNRNEARRIELIKLISEHELLLAQLGEQAASARKVLEERRKQEQIELAKDTKHNKLRLKLNLVQEAQNVFLRTQKLIKDRIRNRVEQKTRDNFLTLIRKEGAFEDVIIRDDYTVQVRHSSGFNVINDLSAGEYLILGLAFMSALTDISGFQAPVIIDTPLGKIDDIHRKYITTELPQFLEGTQLILLVTPTEYDDEVRKNLSAYLLPINCCRIKENEIYESEVVQSGNA